MYYIIIMQTAYNNYISYHSSIEEAKKIARKLAEETDGEFPITIHEISRSF